MEHYLIMKTHTDKNNNSKTRTKMIHEKRDAKIEYLALIDDLKARISFLYSVPYEEFEIEDFGSVIQKEDYYSFNDWYTNKKFEIKLYKIEGEI